MDIPVSHHDFAEGRIIVRVPGPLRRAFLIVDGIEHPRGSRTVIARCDHGSNVSIELRNSVIDPIPSLRIGPDSIQLAPPLNWIEKVWIMLPLMLIFLGGAFGGAFGGIAAMANGWTFRTRREGVVKYLRASFYTAIAVASWVALVLAVRKLGYA